MRQRLILLLAAALTVFAVLAPVASAHKGHGQRVRAVAGTVDASSTLPTTIVLNTKPGTQVTIQNPDAVDVAAVTVGAKVVAKAKVVKAADGTRSLALVAIKVLPAPPYAVVKAAGKVTLGEGTITVATLTFALPEGATMPRRLKDGRLVAVRGVIATEGGTLTLTHLIGRRVHFGHRPGLAVRHHHPKRYVATAQIAGPITAYTAATAEAPATLAVAGINLAVPAGKTLPEATAVGAKACALARVVADVLTLKHLRVKAAAPAPAPTA